MDKARLTKIFNRGFRLGANGRANQGLPLSRTTQPPSDIPESPENWSETSEQLAWALGYATGYQVGASDSELANVDAPGAQDFVSEMSEQMLETFGVFEKMATEKRKA